MNRNIQRIALLWASAAILMLSALPDRVWAQEGGAAAASRTPAGIGVLIFLMGLGAILIVGLYYVGQNRAGRENGQPPEQ